MSRRVPDDDLGVMHEFVALTLRKSYARNARARADGHALDVPWVTVDAAKLSPLLDELRRRRQKPGDMGGFGLGQTAKTLMAMKVGETVDFPPITQGALTTARNTARKRLGIADARWHSETQENRYVKVTRLADGAAQIYGKPKNPAIPILAGMNKNGRHVFTAAQLPNRLPIKLKQQARLALDFAGADWRCTNLANGSVLVVRTK